MRWFLGLLLLGAGIYYGWQWLDGYMALQAWGSFNPESSTYDLVADGWPVLWRTWPFFIPAALLFGAALGLIGYVWGNFATKNDYASDNANLKQQIERLKDRIEEERAKSDDAYHRAENAVKAELDNDFKRLERERQDLAAQQSWLDAKHQEHDAREAKLADAESRIEDEIESFKSKIEQRALLAEHRAAKAEQEAQNQYNKHIQSHRLKVRYEKRYEHAKRQLKQLRESL